MTEAEVAAFVAEPRTVICATNGRDGRPHLTALWYFVRDGEVWAWTYAASQKVRNLERDPRATLMWEDGDTYQTLCGVMLRTDVEIVREVDRVEAVGLAVFMHHSDDDEPSAELLAMCAHQAPKRVALRFIERSRTSWDHSKLGGIY